MTILVMTTQAVMATPRPEFKPEFDLPDLNYLYLDIQHAPLPILDGKCLWPPMTTLVMTTQAVMTTPRPELTPNLTFLTLITYI